MKYRSVVVSGVGIVSPLGNDAQSTWSGLLAGRSGIRELSAFAAAKFPVKVGGEIPSFGTFAGSADRKLQKLVMREVLLGIVAAREAVKDAEVSSGNIDPFRFGLFCASNGSRTEIADLHTAVVSSCRDDGSIDFARFGREGIKEIVPLWLLKSLANNALCHLSIQFNIQGANCNYVASSVGGLQAIGSGLRAIQRGELDLALCVGYDSFVHWEDLLQYSRVGFLARNQEAFTPEQMSRPFDLKRCGAVPSEGGGALLLESEEHACARGVRPYARVLGLGQSINGNSLMAPPEDGHGIAQALRAALNDAQLTPRDLSCLCANGSSSPRLDRAEARGIRAVMGPAASDIVVTAPKSMLGHMMVASAAVECTIAARMVREGCIVPTINQEHPDPECRLNVATALRRSSPLETVACLSSGVGGQNAALIMGRA